MAEWIDQLARAALDGDEPAWNQLFQAITPRLWGLYRHVGVSAAEAEDLIQETWTRVFKHRDRYQRGRPFEPYIFTIAMRLWIDLCRKQRRLPRKQRLPEDTCQDAALPIDMLFAVEESEQIRHCLEILSDEEKTIVVLRFWQDLTNQRIADRLGASEPSIRAKGYRAIHKLADCMRI